MARVIFVNRFYWPDETATGQLLTDLAEALAGLGHDVAVITSCPRRAQPGTEFHRGVRITRLGTTRSNGTGLVAKALDWYSFLLASFAAVRRAAKSGGVVVAMTDPPLLAITTWLAIPARRTRLVHWVQDIYPEIAITVARQHWLAAIRPLRNKAWRAAAFCVTIGQDMAATLGRAGIDANRIVQIANWPPAGLAAQPPADDFRGAWGLSGKFVVGYSGNLGRVHDVMVIADLAESLRMDRSIAFVVVGAGAQRDRLAAEVARRQLVNVSFHAPQPRLQLAAALATADLHLVTLRDGCEGLVFPSKLYGIAAVGRPIVFIGPADCEVAQVVRRNRLGFAASRGDVDQLAGFIRQLAHDTAGRARLTESTVAFAQRHSLAEAARRWDTVLRASAQGPEVT